MYFELVQFEIQLYHSDPAARYFVSVTICFYLEFMPNLPVHSFCMVMFPFHISRLNEMAILFPFG